jgi:hypothetical protein
MKASASIQYALRTDTNYGCQSIQYTSKCTNFGLKRSCTKVSAPTHKTIQCKRLQTFHMQATFCMSIAPNCILSRSSWRQSREESIVRELLSIPVVPYS